MQFLTNAFILHLRAFEKVCLMHTCQLSWIIQESLKYSSDLWLTSAGYQISNKKLTFVLFSALV